MSQLQPHPFQLENVRKILARPARRFWVLDEMGLGKSVTAILAAKELQCVNVLVITKALVRPSWKERFGEWWPSASVGCITMGKSRSGLSGPAKKRLEEAYSAPVQIVSPDLLSNVRPDGWDMIVLDEMHEYVSFRSTASQELRKLFAANPQAYKLGLSGTPLSAEPKNAWNLLQMFWPEKWGKARATGEPPYWFLNLFCERIETDYGVSYSGVNPHTVKKFAESLKEISTRTLRSDVAHLLPPLDISPLVIENKKYKSDVQAAVDWLDTAIQESTHACTLTYLRDTASRLYDTLQSLPRYRGVAVFLLTGDDSPERRARVLRQMREASRAILCGTMDSLGTGISLTFCQQWLMIEPPTTAYKIVQAIGRFNRLDSASGARGFILLRQDGKGDALVAKLRQWLANANSLIRNGQGEATLHKMLEEQSEGSFDAWLDGLVDSYRGELVDGDDEA